MTERSAAGPAARVRWGLPDVVIAWFVGAAASLLALPLADPDATTSEQPIRFLLAVLLVQNFSTAATLLFVARTKGQGSLARDFGFVSPTKRLGLPAAIRWLAAGAGLSLVAQALLWPITSAANLDEAPQEVSRALEDANGVGRIIFALAVVLVAPAVEELLFRGALLRALQRRWSAPVAVFTSAVIFSALHLVGGLGSGYVLPGVLLLGLVSGYQATKTGDLARSVSLHVGFNLLSAVALVAS